ncbi:MAG: pseudouridine synthase [Candidatus Methanoliparum thermophilum]|uniref:Pseudouridine synthase n=1 Tax=Methanoliparum thermophilum TaxID=2491083 RepID=A0A520KR65_METT2|nr:MAG: pseudouridine synthase [Candidatus Methanoliparum thermophilum]
MQKDLRDITTFLNYLRTIADFQFVINAGEILFPDNIKILYSKTGKPRQVFLNGERVATIRPKDGLFTLSILGAELLKEHFSYPSLRVVVMNEVSEFISDGKNVFAKHVIAADQNIKGEEEVIVVNEDDLLLGTGRSVLSAEEMLLFDIGVAVNIRYGSKKRF